MNETHQPLLRRPVMVGFAAVLSLGACAGSAAHPEVSPEDASAAASVLPASDVRWEPLNPARGDASPNAATLWGDRNGAGPTGFLVRFVDGFASPPHIHNVSYRGVVIRGRVHNDDPEAAEMWMPTGSYWTQPLGGAHITAASGGETVAYIEIDEGPYLVRPVEEASVGDEHPLNVHASNLVWLDFATLGWASAGSGRRVAFLWGDADGGGAHGLLLQIPAGSSAAMRGHGSTFRAVVVGGKAGLRSAADGAGTLLPGSLVSSTGGAAELTCAVGAACTWYVRAEGRFEAAPGR